LREKVDRAAFPRETDEGAVQDDNRPLIRRCAPPSPARGEGEIAHGSTHMKFTLSWLKDYLDTSASLDDIVEGLIGVGLEVEDVTDQSKLLAPFKVAYVQEAIKHPNADKLRLCKVETDQGMIQVVCGAPNARTGMKGIVALPGAFIPGTGITLEKGVGPKAKACCAPSASWKFPMSTMASSISRAIGRLARPR
jgi:Putative tRNA binding domain